MSTILNLPYIIYDIILSNDCLDIEDLVSFSKTCKRLRDVSNTIGNYVWRKQFYKRWPKLKDIYKTSEYEQETNFMVLSIMCVKYKKEIHKYLALLPEQRRKKYITPKDITNNFPIHICFNTPMTYYFVINELETYYLTSLSQEGDLGLQDYAVLISLYIHYQYLRYMWEDVQEEIQVLILEKIAMAFYVLLERYNVIKYKDMISIKLVYKKYFSHAVHYVEEIGDQTYEIRKDLTKYPQYKLAKHFKRFFKLECCCCLYRMYKNICYRPSK